MKKAKLSLGLAAVAATAIGLSGCNEVTANEGVVLTFKAEDGTSVKYTANDLFDSVNNNSTAASTAFDKVYEILIRHYYEAPSQKSVKDQINADAQNKVNDTLETAEKNRKSNGTTYEAELEKLLDSKNVDNIDELFDAEVYTLEKAKFEKNYYDDEHIEWMRDGVDANELMDNMRRQAERFGTKMLPNAATQVDLGIRPFHVTLDDGSEWTADSIIIATALAGDTTSERQTFGSIAFAMSDDGSAASYGDLGIVDKNTVTNEYVQEFGLGMYAYDAIYNKTADIAAGRRNAENKANLLPDDSATINSTTTNAKTYFENLGIGTIPYGAAVALASAAEIEDADGVSINDGNATFYPRNVIFNKYFNKHNVAVIVPNEIAYNVATNDNPGAIEAYNDKGTASATYAALPGFSVNTKGLVDVSARNGGTNENVLTDKAGRIVLAVRAGASGSYEGIHFIVINRSALDEFGSSFNGTDAAAELTAKTAGTATLSQYYTIHTPEKAEYPTVSETDKTGLLTYTNFIKGGTNTPMQRSDTVRTKIKGYNNNLNTYIFESLVKSEQLKFNEKNSWVEELINRYISTKRESSKRNETKDFNDKWVTYAEFLSYQEKQRHGGDADNDGMGELISETCAIGYSGTDAKNGTGLWAKGGACGVK